MNIGLSKKLGICLVITLTLTACEGSGDAGRDSNDGPQDSRSGGSSDSGQPDGDSAGAPYEVIARCAGLTVTFSQPGATEYVQWKVDGEADQHEAQPPPKGAYFFNGYLNLTTYAADLNGSLAIGVWGNHQSVPAGTYRCTSGDPTATVSINGLGIANSTAFGADCSVTYDEEVINGGRIVGSFWAYFPPSTWPIASDGGCVHGRFDVTDAAE